MQSVSIITENGEFDIHLWLCVFNKFYVIKFVTILQNVVVQNVLQVFSSNKTDIHDII